MPRDTKWSQTEKRAARRAFDLAYQRECAHMIKQVQRIAKDLDEPDDLWRLSDFLLQRRRDIDDLYDYRYSILPAVLAHLIADRWISLSDLNELDAEKQAFIRSLVENLARRERD